MLYDTDDLRTDEIYLELTKTTEAVPEKGWVPAYHFKICLVKNDAEAGKCSLRVGEEEILYYNGHIGYVVFEPYRGNHYAGKACVLLFVLARKHGIKRLYITCNPDNHASSKTCEYAGCVFEKTADLPPEHEMYKRGERKKLIYHIDL